jgi:hypothetical protein
MARKNEFTYSGGSQYIDWLCRSNKLVLLRDNDNVKDEDKTSIVRALKCISGDILCLVLGRNISSFAYHKIIEDMGGRTTESIVKSKNPVFSSIYWTYDKKAALSSHTIFIPWKELKELIKDWDYPTYFQPEIV